MVNKEGRNKVIQVESVDFSEPAPKSFFLNDSIFETPIFEGQKTPLFTPDSDLLRAELMKCMMKMHNPEYFYFLQELQFLNSQQHLPRDEQLSRGELEQALQQFDGKHLREITLKDEHVSVINSPHRKKKLASYEGAIKEVFDVIKSNLATRKDMLQDLRRVDDAYNSQRLFEGGTSLIDELDQFTSIKQGSASDYLKLSHWSSNSPSNAFSECQKLCKSARKQLGNLMENPPADFEAQFTKTLAALERKLSSAVSKVEAYEKQSKLANFQSQSINNLLSKVDLTLAALNLAEPSISERKISSVKDAGNIGPEGEYISPKRR